MPASISPAGCCRGRPSVRWRRGSCDDIYKRPFITVGFAAFVAMVPLALTSTAGMIRRLGGRRWQHLHRLIYPAAIAGVIHYWMLVKSDIRLPAYYGLVVAILLAVPAVLGAPRKSERPRLQEVRGAETLVLP